MRYRQLPLEQINVTDRNIRKTTSEEGMAELTASIDRFGLLQPIVVFETGEDEYDLVAGHRRFAAVCELGWDSIPAMVTKSEEQSGILAQWQENIIREDMSIKDELQAISDLLQLSENTQREDLEDIEEAQTLLRIAGGRQTAGGDRCSEHYCSAIMDQKTLAELVGKSQAWVQVRMALLLDLPNEVRTRVTRKPPTSPEHAPGIAVNTAAEIARLKDNPDLQVRLADKVEREGMTKPQTRRAVQKIKEDPDAAEAVLNAKVDDSSFDAVTQRKTDKTPAKQAPPPPSDAPDRVMRSFSQGYQKLLDAFDEDRIREVEDGERFAEVCADIAYNACYLRTLLDNVIHDWALEKKCGWTQEQAAEVASMGGARVVGLELIEEASQ